MDIAVLWRNSYFDKITKIGAVVNYWECAHDHPEGIWDFPFVIQMNILNEVLYSSNVMPVYAFSPYWDVAVSHAIESNLYKQQCSYIGLIRTHQYNTLFIIYNYILHVNKLSWMWAMHTPYKLFNCFWTT